MSLEERINRGAVNEVFAATALASPEREAVWADGVTLTYKELQEQNATIAINLWRLGVRPGDRVALSVPRNPRLVPLILGILGAGAAFVPIEPGQPPARARFVCEEAGVRWLIADADAAVGLGFSEDEIRRLEPEELLDASSPATLPLPSLEAVAYVMFTSGSTGRPKGVAVPHEGLVNLVAWAAAELGEDRLRRTVFSTSLSFDVAMFELFAPLAVGGCVHVVDSPFDLAALPADLAPTLYSMVPSVAAELVHESLFRPGAAVVLAGEQVPTALVGALLQAGAAEVWNCYGPTEATVYATFAQLAEGEERPPIGRPLPGTRAHVLDPSLRPVGGEPGELFIGGKGVAQAYVNRPDLTAERFLPEPGVPGGRMYRTGDVVRRREDGQLEFLGRADDQLKIKGVRIEPAEIESALLRHPTVTAAVVGRYAPEGGTPILVAYVRRGATTEPTQVELLDHLRSHLPAEMVPARVVVLDELPRTLSGKVDRRALPAPPEERGPAVAWEAPSQRLVAEAWGVVLGTGSHFGLDDNFFDVGGHSFLLLRLKQELARRSGKTLRVVDMFRYPTVRSMGAFLDGDPPPAAPLPARAPSVAGDRLARVRRAQAER